jgi:hypothetical protein
MCIHLISLTYDARTLQALSFVTKEDLIVGQMIVIECTYVCTSFMSFYKPSASQRLATIVDASYSTIRMPQQEDYLYVLKRKRTHAGLHNTQRAALLTTFHYPKLALLFTPCRLWEELALSA